MHEVDLLVLLGKHACCRYIAILLYIYNLRVTVQYLDRYQTYASPLLCMRLIDSENKGVPKEGGILKLPLFCPCHYFSFISNLDR